MKQNYYNIIKLKNLNKIVDKNKRRGYNKMVKLNYVSLKTVKDKEVLTKLKTRQVKSPKDVVDTLQELIGDNDREELILFTLDTKNQINAIHTVSVGSLNASIVHPREVFKLAIVSNPASIIIAHDHPSGNPVESKEDINITKRIKEAGKILGIELLDHIIVGDNSYRSLKEMGYF